MTTKKLIKRLLLVSLATVFSGSILADKLSESKSVDVSKLTGSDNQLLIQIAPEKVAPARPNDPKKYPESDTRHWYDIEYAPQLYKELGKLPSPPKDGAMNKNVVVMVMGPHPYFEALMDGFNKIAEKYKWNVKTLDGNWSIATQKQQAEIVVNERPDMVFIIPTDTKAIAPILRRINKAGIPVFPFNGLPTESSQKYAIGWTGPDDWGQMRLLSQVFADKLNKKGGYAIVRHNPGSSPFFARTFAPISELTSYAPDMKLLDMAPGGFDAAKIQGLVGAWITKYGKDLNGLILAGDGVTMVGALEALKNAGREDIVVVAAGHSKVGLDAVRDGNAYAITMQSANSDGAVVAAMGARWLNGEKIPRFTYLKQHIITTDDVETFYPPQW
jgi:ABC-type sugar transport system substrate-binding protein